MKLIKIVKSSNPKKKFDAIFEDNGRTSKTSFGAAGMDDYTLTGDKDARRRYRARHKKDLQTRNPKRAGYLSYFILWGDSQNINTNIREYKKKFKL